MKQAISLRDYRRTDEQQLLDLNTLSVEATSPMDSARLRDLLSCGCRIRVAGKDNTLVAFLMTFVDGSQYDSSNYRWFCERIKSFVYVDRIVVTESVRGSGVGRQLYAALIQQAIDDGLKWVAAEINIQPPNEQSLVFHRKQGFAEVGRQQLAAGKVVAMQLRGL